MFAVEYKLGNFPQFTWEKGWEPLIYQDKLDIKEIKFVQMSDTSEKDFIWRFKEQIKNETCEKPKHIIYSNQLWRTYA